MILNLHRRATANLGDLASAPTRYFDTLKNARIADVLGWDETENRADGAREAWMADFATARGLILGGGGLLGIDFFKPALDFVFGSSRRQRPVILWGAGHNNWQIGDWRALKERIMLDQWSFDLVGVRDYGQGHRWVPCASCMTPALDTAAEATNEFVVYLHEANREHELVHRALPPELPRMHNDGDLATTIAFLASGDTILTDSYHGAYWGTLLGRKVVAFPSSSKFYGMKHPVPLCAPEDWRRHARLSIRYPEAIGECRMANKTFALDAAALLGL